jgi:hypothetical protein
MSAKITVTRQVVRTSFLTTNQFDRAGYSGHNISRPGRTPTPRNRVFYARVRPATRLFVKKTRFLGPHASRTIELEKIS